MRFHGSPKPLPEAKPAANRGTPLILFEIATLVLCLFATSSFGGPADDELDSYDFHHVYKAKSDYQCVMKEKTTTHYSKENVLHVERELDLSVRILEQKDGRPKRVELNYDSDHSKRSRNDEEAKESLNTLTGVTLQMEEGSDNTEINGRTFSNATLRFWKTTDWDNVWKPSKPVLVGESWQPDKKKATEILCYGVFNLGDYTDEKVVCKVTASFQSIQENVATILLKASADIFAKEDEDEVSMSITMALEIHFDVRTHHMKSWQFDRSTTSVSSLVQGSAKSEIIDTASTEFKYPSH